MKTETEQMAYNLALAWFETRYTKEQAQQSAEWQGIPFADVYAAYHQIETEVEAEINGN